MTELVPFEYSDDRSYDEQIKDALEKALSIHGTVINDLQQAMNCILQMERAMNMTGTPNPMESEVIRLKAIYKMTLKRDKKNRTEAQKLLDSGSMELIEGEIIDD